MTIFLGFIFFRIAFPWASQEDTSRIDIGKKRSLQPLWDRMQCPISKKKALWHAFHARHR